jgi:hypothetical protein
MMLPAHKKEWAEAMLNEAEYSKSHREALQWVLGCVFAALQERVAYELGRTLMNRKARNFLLGLGAMLVATVIGIYITAKPYQRERIWIALGQTPHSEQSKHSN